MWGVPEVPCLRHAGLTCVCRPGLILPGRGCVRCGCGRCRYRSGFRRGCRAAVRAVASAADTPAAPGATATTSSASSRVCRSWATSSTVTFPRSAAMAPLTAVADSRSRWAVGSSSSSTRGSRFDPGQAAGQCDAAQLPRAEFGGMLRGEVLRGAGCQAAQGRGVASAGRGAVRWSLRGAQIQPDLAPARSGRPSRDAAAPRRCPPS